MQEFGAWSPDLPAYGGSHATEAKGCIPLTGKSYGPLRTPTGVSDALPGNARGLVSTKGVGVANYTFAGSLTKLYELDNDGSWVDVSRASGGDYALGDEDRWKWVTYRERVVASAGISEKLQTRLLGTDALFDDLDDVGTGTPPQAKHIAIARDFVVVGHTYDTVDGESPGRIWWSAIGDPTTWPTPGSVTAQSVQSDFRDLAGGGAIMAILPGIGGADAIIFGERRIWAMDFVGPPVQFNIRVVDPARGLYSQGAITTNGQIAFYLAEDGWYAFDGVQSTPIGADKFDKWFLGELDDSRLDGIWAEMDSAEKLLIVAFPGSGNSGFCNRLFVLNWETGRPTHADLPQEVQVLAALRSVGFTLESLDALGYTLDTLPASLDSRQWAGGAAYMGVITSERKLASFSGTTFEAVVEGPEQTADDSATARTLIQGVRPYGDTASVFCAVKTRNLPGETPVQTTYVPIAANGVAYQRANARFIRACVKVAAGASWTHLQGFDLVGKPLGSR